MNPAVEVSGHTDKRYAVLHATFVLKSVILASSAEFSSWCLAAMRYFTVVVSTFWLLGISLHSTKQLARYLNVCCLCVCVCVYVSVCVCV